MGKQLPNNTLEQEETFFLPNLCARESVFFLVLIAELFALVIVLAQEDILIFDWAALGLISLFVQWVALSSALILCGLRDFLRRIPQKRAVVLGYLVIPVNTWVAASMSRWLISPYEAQEVLSLVFSRPVLNQVAISAIVGGLVIRYFYLHAQLLARRQSELLHRIQALQSRIRPHFLFNSMNIIASLIETDPKTAEVVVEDLSSLFRASLNHVGNQVSLEEEIALCKKFLHIEQLRLGKRLDVQWEVRSVPEAIKIPLLTLQPILENAVLHGVQPLPEGGSIEIVARYAHGVFELSVHNPCVLLPSVVSDQSNQMALDNIRHRLQALYGERARLTGYREDNRYITRLSYPYPVATGKEGK